MSWAGIGKTQWDNTQFDRQEGMSTEERGRLRALEAENKGLRKAGQTLYNRVSDVLDNIIDESALLDALEKWDIAKEEKQ